LEADGYNSPGSSSSTPVSIPSPSPLENLSGHPFFRDEFALPFDESFESLISLRRMRTTASIPSSPAPSPSVSGKKRGGKKRGKSKLDMAGLVGGDSDSSALTQESGDEGAPPTPRESVVTGTDGGTDYAEEEDVEMREPSPGKR
jgi:MRG-binding protein